MTVIIEKGFMKRILSLFIGFLFSGVLLAENIEKANLRILYVGGASDYTDYGSVSAELKSESVRARTASFKSMLSEYFDSVTVVDGADYRPEISDSYDVTIIDGRIPEIKPAIRESDSNGSIVKYVPAQLLPDDFDRAVITIGSMGEIVGRAIGSKNDWYCLCLDADAHHMVLDHPIFNGPFETELTFEKKPTPEDAFHYKYFHEGDMPDSLMMWKVQTKGYKTDKDFAVGMVSRPWGYTDSPDAEYISSGVCAKTLDAVAIGRHGNFMTWGFAASPLYMTEEAKTVFANAVCYMAGFNGKKMIARKYNDGIATREYLKELLYLVSDEAYEDRSRLVEKMNTTGEEMKKKALEKKKKGTELEEDEKYYLNFQPEKMVSRNEFLKRYQKEAYNMFGDDVEAYIKYYNENRNYFYGGEGSYNLFVDEDCKAWGIANNSPDLLEKAISSLEKGKETERALRILDRYTMCGFGNDAGAWRKWYDTYGDRIFFTEAGGWLFMVNGSSDIPGNDYSVKTDKKVSGSDSVTTDEEPVHVSLSQENDRIVIRFIIQPGYHIYSKVSSSDAYIPVSIDIDLPEGISAGEPIMPVGINYGTTGTVIYENEARIIVPLSGNGKGRAVCRIGWQCCDSHVCMPPQSREYSLDINY